MPEVSEGVTGKNSEFTGVIESLGSNGEGIVHIGETVFFAPFTAVGEKVKLKALKVKKQDRLREGSGDPYARRREGARPLPPLHEVRRLSAAASALRCAAQGEGQSGERRPAQDRGDNRRGAAHGKEREPVRVPQ